MENVGSMFRFHGTTIKFVLTGQIINYILSIKQLFFAYEHMCANKYKLPKKLGHICFVYIWKQYMESINRGQKDISRTTYRKFNNEQTF